MIPGYGLLPNLKIYFAGAGPNADVNFGLLVVKI